MPILTTLRSNTIDRFHSAESEEGSLYCYSDVIPFLKAAVPAYKKAMRDGDILATKILSYTNVMVTSYNNCIRVLCKRGKCFLCHSANGSLLNC